LAEARQGDSDKTISLVFNASTQCFYIAIDRGATPPPTIM